MATSKPNVPLRKVGTYVKIKSKNWYNRNKSDECFVDVGHHLLFTPEMVVHCGKLAKIVEVDKHDNSYKLDVTDENVWFIEEFFTHPKKVCKV